MLQVNLPAQRQEVLTFPCLLVPALCHSSVSSSAPPPLEVDDGFVSHECVCTRVSQACVLGAGVYACFCAPVHVCLCIQRHLSVGLVCGCSRVRSTASHAAERKTGAISAACCVATGMANVWLGFLGHVHL